MRIEAMIPFFTLSCFGSAVELPWKCRGNPVEVPMKCHLSANRQKPTATTMDLYLITPQLSTLGWSKTAHFNDLWQKWPPTLFWKLFHHWPILGICSLTRCLNNTRMLVVRDDTHIHTYIHAYIQTDIVTLWLTRPRGQNQWEKKPLQSPYL